MNALTERAYVTDCATPLGALCPVFVVLFNATLPAGTLHNFRMWNQGRLGGSPTTSAGNLFEGYVLRSTCVAVQANDVLGFCGEGTVNKATSRVVVTTGGSPAAAATTVVLTATVTAVRPGSNVRTGTVPLCAVTGPMRAPPVALNTSGQAALALSNAGTRPTYGFRPVLRGGNFNLSTSPSISQRIRSGRDVPQRVFHRSDGPGGAELPRTAHQPSCEQAGVIMEISRRTLFGASAAVGVGLLLPPLRLPTAANAAVPLGLTPFTERLPTLSEIGVIDATTGASATITMITTTHKFHSALARTPTFAYRSEGGAQDYLGPVIVAKQGVPFNLTVKNNLGPHPLAFAIDPALVPPGDDAQHPRAAVHLHGGNTEVQHDGGPLDTFRPGHSRTYTHGNTQEAAGLWYHDHALGITRLNVFAGLASGYLIRNDDDDGSGSRLPAPPYEVPLVIQDRMFKADGTFDYPANENPSTPRPWSPEFFGDVATVNGKAWPNLNVDRGKYRFRVYNGSNARFYNLRFLDGVRSLTFHQIGSDGGLLNAPVPLNQLLLAPGERADLVVDFAGLRPGTTITVFNGAVAPYPTGPRRRRRGGSPLHRIMQFTVNRAAGWTQPLPAKLRATRITRLADRPVAATRSMTLVEIHDADDAPLMVLVNNRNFDTAERTIVGKDTLEQWDLINTTVDAHPMHLHFTQFQVLNRQKFDAAAYVAVAYGAQPVRPNTGSSIPVTPFLTGGTRAPDANERGWKDTVLAMPGEVTRIVVPFGANAVPGSPMAIRASHIGEYAWHCHIVEHEDNDMMQRFVIQ